MGVFGQLLVVFPDHEATLALTSAINGVNACSGTLLPRVYKHFPGVFTGSPGDQDAAEESLASRSARAATMLPVTCVATPAVSHDGWLEYRLDPNPLDLSALRLKLTSKTCALRLAGAQGEQRIDMGLGHWLEGEASVPAPELHHGYEMRQARVVASARWTAPDTLAMTWIFVESAFRDTVTCRFEGDRVRYSRHVNVNSGATSQPELTGRRTEDASSPGR
jgi:hypothetical protein